MGDHPDWLKIPPDTESDRTGVFRRVTSILMAGFGLLFLVPPLYATILDWRRNGLTQLLAMLPCSLALAAPFLIWAWRIRNGPLTENQRVFGARLSTALLVTLLAIDALLILLVFAD